jgi:Ni,Fe-hydrogenase III large subunit
MTSFGPKSFPNGTAVPRAAVPSVAPRAFRDLVVAACDAGARVCELFAVAEPGGFALHALMAHDDVGRLSLLSTRLAAGGSFPSLAASLPAVQAMERALLEDHGLVPDGHPWLKALRVHPELPGGHAPAAAGRAPAHPFFQVEGPGIHEVAVGPVHAGVIEPGHFRFQCAGETVHTLEIHLGYQHRGALARIVAAPAAHRPAIVESLVGDGAVSHGLAHCAAVEGLTGCRVPDRARALRVVALELERISDHVGDFGALCNDVGYLPAASWCPRLRGDIQNALGLLTGHRFGRGFAVPGGLASDPGDARLAELDAVLATFAREFADVAALALDAPSVLSRFEGTGTVRTQDARALGLLGIAARASGLDRDARRDHPLPGDRAPADPTVVLGSGDVAARARIRVLEIAQSVARIRAILASPGDGPGRVVPGPARPDAIAVGIAEGSRGQVTHVAVTGTDGELVDYRAVDPSLLDWPGLAMALRGQQISDFPLCNKSFDLSYAGHDL